MSIAGEIIDGLWDFGLWLFSRRRSEKARIGAIMEPLLIKALAVRDVVLEAETSYFFGRGPDPEDARTLWVRIRAKMRAYRDAIEAARHDLVDNAIVFDRLFDECTLFLNGLYHEKVAKPEQGLREDPAELSLLYVDFTKVNKATALYEHAYNYCKKYFLPKLGGE